MYINKTATANNNGPPIMPQITAPILIVDDADDGGCDDEGGDVGDGPHSSGSVQCHSYKSCSDKTKTSPSSMAPTKSSTSDTAGRDLMVRDGKVMLCCSVTTRSVTTSHPDGIIGDPET